MQTKSAHKTCLGGYLKQAAAAFRLTVALNVCS